MAEKKETPLAIAAQGLVSGMGGALALTVMTSVGRKVRHGKGNGGRTGDGPQTAGEALSETPSTPPSMNEMTATFVQKVATGLFGTNLSREQQYVAGVAWHLAYGGFWGMLYALIASSVSLPRLLLAPLYGLAVWAIGPGWLVPKMKVMLPPDKEEPRTRAMVVGGHVMYGGLVAFGCRLFRRSA